MRGPTEVGIYGLEATDVRLGSKIKPMATEKRRALVLSGGGARGAYQVGVLKGISEICKTHHVDPDFKIYSGISAGSINAAYMATYADDFHLGVSQLVEMWSKITSDQVFASDVMHMGKIAFQWMGELSLGALVGTTLGKALLDTTPLIKLINDNLNLERIEKHVDSGKLYALAVTSTDYGTSNSVTFVQGDSSIKDWKRTRRLSKKTKLTTQHIMGSSAIPLLFPPAAVGQKFFGDGCVRNNSPCAPSIYLGADALFVVGVRMSKETSYDKAAAKSTLAPSVARVLNVLLNAILLDGIETDVEHLHRMNKLLDHFPGENQANYRKVDALLTSPSGDIGELAIAKSKNLPTTVRYLLKGLGKIEDAGELVSYLLFDKEFCGQLIEMGCRDAHTQEAQILQFFKN